MAVTVGVLGLAHGHVNTYLAQWRDHPEMDVRAVAAWDHDAGRLAQAEKNYGLQPCGEVSRLLGDPGIEAVVVAAETSLHASLVEQAAAAGKKIILQKPMALTMAEGERIVSAVERAGVPFTLAWQMRVDPQNVQMKELLASGELGKVFMVRRRHGLAVHTWGNFVELWHNKPELNRDIWADDAAHAIDFIHWLLGVPETVTAEIATIHDARVPNDNGIAIYRYPGGPIAEVVCSFTCPAHENTTEIVCEKGSIIQNYGDVPSCNVPRPEGAPGLKWYTLEKKEWTFSEIASPPGHGHRIAGLAGPLAEFLHGRRAPIATAEDGLTSLRMTLATYLSSREGRRVTIDDPRVAEI